jgi:hypothetical protein
MAPVIKSSIVDSLWRGYKKAVAASAEFIVESGLNISTAGLAGSLKSIAPKATGAKDDKLLGYLDAYFLTLKNSGVPTWSQAIIKGLFAALGGAICVMSAAGIMAEATLMRPLRKEFMPQQPTADEIIAGWRRGNYSEAERDTMLREIGYSFNDAQALVELSWFTPQVQDIIRFAVREVYNPQTRAAFKQDEGADEVAKTAAPWLLKAGIRPEVLKDYWAAHWELPSITQGFEMLQRGAISGEDLDRLLKAADVMPFWREALKKISYAPLTRVDVRRMHKAGVIDDDQLLKAYMDLGYDQENAKRLADWTIIYNQDPENAESTWSDAQTKKYRDLSTSDILDGYQEGLLTEQFATQVLGNYGYSAEEITFMLARQDFLAQKSALTSQLKHVKTAFLAGDLSETDVIGLIGKYNLPASYSAKILEDMKLERALKAQGPTKAEVISWHKKKLIDRATAEAQLTAMGYAKKWVDLYLTA